MVKASIAQSTLKAYESVKAESHWIDFLNSDYSGDFVNAKNMFLVHNEERDKQEALCLFINYLDKCVQKTRNSIGSIMAALRFLFLCDFQDITFFESHVVKQVRKGLIERGRCNAVMKVKGTTMFLTIEMLQWLRAQVFSTGKPIDLKKFMICISILLAFHFGYRVGEIAISNGNEEHTIQNRDVIFEDDKGNFINAVDARYHDISVILLCIVILRSRKADQTGGGDPYFICRYTGASIQLLEDMFWWAQNSANDPDEIFFYRPNVSRKNIGYRLRGKEISEMIRIAAVHFDMDESRFSGRSLRVSAASHLSAQRLPQEACQSVTGHASTSSYNIYVRGTVKDLGVLDLEVTEQLSVQDIRRAMLSSRG